MPDPLSAQSSLARERDEALLERDEMRRANVTPADGERPLGQSVVYWQDRCLDHATALDRARVENARLNLLLRDLVSAYMAGDDLGPIVARAEDLTGGQQHGP